VSVMPIKRRDAKGNLLQKGFKDEKNRDHDYFFFYHEGKKTSAYTYFSRGSQSKDVDDSLLKVMMRPLKLDKSQQVRDLFLCPLDGEQYAEILRGKNIIGPCDQ